MAGIFNPPVPVKSAFTAISPPVLSPADRYTRNSRTRFWLVMIAEYVLSGCGSSLMLVTEAAMLVQLINAGGFDFAGNRGQIAVGGLEFVFPSVVPRLRVGIHAGLMATGQGQPGILRAA